MSKSLHARKSIAKITALPNCINMAGGGGFTGSNKNTPHIRGRYGKRKECVKCQFGVSNKWIMPGSFKMKPSQFSANSSRRTRLIPCDAKVVGGKNIFCGCWVWVLGRLGWGRFRHFRSWRVFVSGKINAL